MWNFIPIQSLAMGSAECGHEIGFDLGIGFEDFWIWKNLPKLKSLEIGSIKLKTSLRKKPNKFFVSNQGLKEILLKPKNHITMINTIEHEHNFNTCIFNN